MMSFLKKPLAVCPGASAGGAGGWLSARAAGLPLLLGLAGAAFLAAFLPKGALAEEAPHPAPPLPESQGADVSFMEAILSAHFIVQATLVILALMSVVSWAIIFQKWALFKSLKEESAFMDDVFLKSGAFEDIYNTARSHETSPLARIFISGYNEMRKALAQPQIKAGMAAAEPAAKKDSKKADSRQIAGSLDNVERALRKGLENELAMMEEGLGFLATAGSSCPFIGLFGTVFGIMNSFNEIARMGSASLHIVAPGIAEALIATGLGLFAAIPASVFYNIFLGHIRRWDREGGNFSIDFINIAKRNFFHERH